MENLASSNSLSRIPGKDDASLFKSNKQRSGLSLELAKGGKRVLDIVTASAALVFLLPLFMLLLGVLLVLQGRPIFIRHNRVGRGGALFPCLKFRSMVTNSDEVLREHLTANSAARQEWEETHKLKNDPRITPLGQFLRKSSIDELPQLLNVIRGDMSLVGPRPIVRDEMVRYGAHIEDYLKVRPGLTGLWQVSGRSDVSYQHRVSLDVRYVREWSLWSDIVIILKTIPAVLRPSGSY
ncbi:sugar transferase [Labrys sedimenti]|uniref:sugar transferase n=1 Tax=Labrys sedimenti TaxID=3106036 RepID=UPI003CD076D6